MIGARTLCSTSYDAFGPWAGAPIAVLGGRCADGGGGMTAETETVLECIECGARSEGAAHGWRALLTDGEHEPEAVAVYCPDCAREEFGNG